jgi:hypothetical protein
MRLALVLALGAAVVSATYAADAPLLDDLDRSSAEMERVAGAVARAALAGDGRELARTSRAVTDADERRRDAGQLPTGLADEAALLEAALAPSIAARRTALRNVLDDLDGDTRRLGTWLQSEDDAESTARLLADDRHDRRATLVNDAVRPFGIGTNLLAIVNPVLLAGSAVDTIVSTTRNVLRYDRLSSREREALARYHTAVARNAAGERSPDLARATRRLSAKRRKALCKAAIDDAGRALDAGMLARVAARLREAEALDECAERTAEMRERLGAAERAAARAADEAAWPAVEPALPRNAREEQAWSALALAVVTADPAEIRSAAERLIELDDDGPLVPGARLSMALAHARVEDALRDLRDDDTPVGQYAAGLLDGPGFVEAAALVAAERRHRAGVARFVALGGVSGTTSLKGAAHLAAYGAAGAQSLGIGNAIGMLARAYRAWRHDPIPNDAIIARGEEYLARNPVAADRDRVRERLATAYERAQRFDRALLHLRATEDPDADDVARLEKKLGRQMLERARADDGDPALLAAIVEHLPGTDAADTAREALETARAGGLSIGREELARHPDLLGPDGLDLAPGLLDGNGDNGEIADEGIALRAGALELSLEADGDEPRLDRRALDAGAIRRAYAAAESLLYREALARPREGDERGRFEDYVPFFITGTVGQSGVNVYPGIKLRPHDSDHPERYR